MVFELIDPISNFLAQSCSLAAVLVGVLLVTLGLTRLIISSDWWQGWGND